jgi:transcriptional regulator with XRE-family HTH domain
MKMNASIDNSNIRATAGAIISEARRLRGYTLEDLAETSGLTADELMTLETADLPNRSHALRAGAALGVAPGALSI